jgi:glycosyltransferase involved in cell wall biosynthesis
VTKLRIAYVSMGDCRDTRYFSGTAHYMWRALLEVANIQTISPLPPLPAAVRRLLLAAARIGFPVSTNEHWSTVVARWYASVVRKQLRPCTDLVFGPGHIPLVGLGQSVPWAFHADATFGQMVGFYPGWECGGPELNAATRMQLRALSDARCALYSSEWAADSAIHLYGADRNKVSVIPYGANIDDVPDADTSRKNRLASRLRLLFVGRDWYRKGGDTAMEVARLLHKQDRLEWMAICGSVGNPSLTVGDLPIRVYPSLDKSRPADAKLLQDLYLASHFLVLPTRADCTPIVCCEAMASGLPIVGSDVGGMRSLVFDGVNGLLMPSSASPDVYAQRIQAVTAQEYRGLRRGARALYEERFNWTSWRRSVMTLLSEHLS